MIRALIWLLALLSLASPAAAQLSNPPDTSRLPRMIYSSNGSSVTVGNNSTAQATMLPPGASGSSLLIRANTLPPGSCLNIKGSGVISAATAGAGNFTLTFTMTSNGGTVTTLPGFTAAPLIGVVGITWLDITFCQTATGLQYQGPVSYAQSNSANNYPNMTNGTNTVVASDWTVDRTFAALGQWQNANAANYVTVQFVVITIWPLAP